MFLCVTFGISVKTTGTAAHFLSLRDNPSQSAFLAMKIKEVGVANGNHS